MIEELYKIGDINSIGDLFDFKLSIKTIILLFIIWGMFVFVFVVFMLGGINNTIDYATNIIESTKQSIIINKNKKINSKNETIKNETIKNETIKNETTNNEE
jgi:hypothetical protein